MNKKALSLAICLAMAIPTASNALSLGEIESKSSLNQPFQGRINLLQTNPAEVKSLRVKVASPEVFNRVGIDRPAFLNSIRFRTTVQNGKPVILVSSNQPINEPFLNFLLEVSWPNGQLLKEYTVLLDPPVLLRPNTAITSNNAGIRAEPRAQGQIRRAPQMTPQQLQAQRQRQAQQAQRQAQAKRQAQQSRRQASTETLFDRQARAVLQGQPQARRVASAPVRSTSTSTNYRVRKGDTLSKIAKKLAVRGVRSDQMMVALFEKNRRAFSQGNMNNLKAGATMARPSAAEARSVTSRTARAQIIAQARAWKSKRTEQIASNDSGKSNSARLEVLGNSNNANANSSSSAGSVAGLNKQLALLTESLTTKQQENTELKSRVSELESLLRKKNRLIALKSEQLASLQTGMSSADPQRTQQATEAQDQTQENTETAENIGQGIQDQVAGELASENGEIVRTTPDTSVVDNTPIPEEVIPEVEEPVVAQQQQAADPFKAEEESGLDIMGLVTSPIGLAAGAGSLGLLGLFALMRRRKNKGETAEDFSDLIDSGLNDQAIDEEVFDEVIDNNEMIDESEYVMHDNVQAEETDTSTAAQSGDDLEDLIQEADVYIVYGLHDQAESEIKRALNSYPDNAALHAKLLENYKAAGDAEAFEEATKTFMNLETDDKQNYWDEICEWGNNLLPDSKLYNSSALAGMAAAATGATMVAGTAFAASDDLDIDDNESLIADMADLTEDSISSEIEADDLIEDTILDEFDSVEAPESMDDIDLDDALDEFDLDSILDEDNDNETIVADLDDDFEIDLDDDFSDILDEDIQEKAEDLLADSDSDSDSEDSIEDTDFLFDDDSLEDLLNEDSAESSVAKAANLNLEIDSDGFDKIMPEDHAYNSKSDDVELNFDDLDDDTDLDEEDNLLADFDDNLSFLDLDDDAETIGDTQIETKIDLARAYIDMGDMEGAKSTLEEVMEEGSEEQKRQAEELMHHNG